MKIKQKITTMHNTIRKSLKERQNIYIQLTIIYNNISNVFDT